ncbi:MAG: hypothetical protein IPM20_06320 [Gammaproteobacteria bacterium]|nr:hypothetical protein [Gammaproteobacteria bacterium]
MKIIIAGAAVTLLAACGQGASSMATSGLSGVYGGNECLFQDLTFKSDGSVRFSQFGSDEWGDYKIDGDKVLINTNKRSVAFTRNGDSLDFYMNGQKSFVCNKM